MGEVMSWAAALAFLGVMRAWDALEEDRKSRQEEVFVPFNLSSLQQREQPIRQPATEAKPHIAVTASAAQSTL